MPHHLFLPEVIMAKKPALTECPCAKGVYTKCCGRFIEAGEIPATAEQLMRSRYTAYVLRDEPYLKATWHPDTLPDDPLSEDDVKWIGLDVRKYTHTAASLEATVEFIARFKVAGRAHRIHEISQFVKQADATGQERWYYVDGTFPEDNA
jgi:SEC-C motif-containing protein